MSYRKLTRVLASTSIVSDSIVIGRDTAHHLMRVLRIKTGDYVRIFHPDSGEFLGKINSIDEKGSVIDVIEKLKDRDVCIGLTLAFAPIKPDRQRFMIEKCTEIGVDEFVPVITQRAIIKGINIEKTQHYMEAASTQSERLSIPTLHKCRSLENFLNTYKESKILFCDELASPLEFISHQINAKEQVVVFVGPEGGFSEMDRALLSKFQNVKHVSLGKNILRAETAAIFAVSSVIHAIFSR